MKPLLVRKKRFFVHQVARGIFNLSYAFDPDIILIGGGVSQADWLIPDLTKELNNLKQIVGIAPFVPNIARCRFQNAANLMGATVEFFTKKTNYLNIVAAYFLKDLLYLG